MSWWRERSLAGVAALAGCGVLAGCGGGERQDAHEPSGNFNVQIEQASFPASQRLAQQTHFVVTVRNADQRTIPDIAVTIEDPRLGTSAQAFGYRISSPSLPGLADPSRPAWIVDDGPEPHGCQYSCREGGPGGAVTAYSNTWALGALAPGHSARFDWSLTAVHPGTYTVRYRIAAGLNGKSHAVLQNGAAPEGTFHVTISDAPRKALVNGNGQVVTQ